MRRSRVLVASVALSMPLVAQSARPVGTGGTLALVQSLPGANSVAPAGTAITLVFDEPVALSSLDADGFHVFGRNSGVVSGQLLPLNGGRRVLFVPTHPFAAGEVVSVQLTRSVHALDGSHLRAAGHAFQFGIAVAPSGGTFTQYAQFSNRIAGQQTRIYGANAIDLDGDQATDLATVNEVSADVRVFLNLANGTGNYAAMLAPEPIGVEGSPNDAGDFDRDGDVDLCIAASSDDEVWILLGNGDGSFAPGQAVTVGQEPHGIVAFDVDGDGDTDIVNANRGSNNLSLLRNDGSGGFGPPTFFEGGVDSEYGLAAGDMDADGILDLVVAGQGGQHVRTTRGNGNGTFTPVGTARNCGGQPWVVVLGDIDGDGDLDAATANTSAGTSGLLKNSGTGSFAPATTVSVGGHIPSTDLGDLDGDGDLDLVVSSFGGGYWRMFRNDGTGAYAFWRDLAAVSNPSCSILVDTDRDGDLDLALTDEIADLVTLQRNQ